eukprot:TRINITY_DN4324_c0_g1_i2.p1 TRINITY_DN4324_c0_g1~~TRINITY_DN4324_c0_g1_i2.p1  ORF type:complete len:380 (+),score=88.49 TRINITY_DN4324_c0_g1_i2:83-1222(+)
MAVELRFGSAVGKTVPIGESVTFGRADLEAIGGVNKEYLLAVSRKHVTVSVSHTGAVRVEVEGMNKIWHQPSSNQEQLHEIRGKGKVSNPELATIDVHDGDVIWLQKGTAELRLQVYCTALHTNCTMDMIATDLSPAAGGKIATTTQPKPVATSPTPKKRKASERLLDQQDQKKQAVSSPPKPSLPEVVHREIEADDSCVWILRCARHNGALQLQATNGDRVWTSRQAHATLSLERKGSDVGKVEYLSSVWDMLERSQVQVQQDGANVKLVWGDRSSAWRAASKESRSGLAGYCELKLLRSGVEACMSAWFNELCSSSTAARRAHESVQVEYEASMQATAKLLQAAERDTAAQIKREREDVLKFTQLLQSKVDYIEQLR